MYIHPILFGLLKSCRVCKDPSLFASAKCTRTPSVVTSEHTLDWVEDENKKENKNTAQHSSVSLGIFAISQENSPSVLLKCMKQITNLLFFPLFCWPPFCPVACEGTLTASWENLLSWMLCALCTYYSTEFL